MQTRFQFPGRMAAVTAGALFVGLLVAGCHDQPPPPAPPNVVNLPPPATVTTPGGTTGVTPAGTATVAPSPDTKINTNAGPGASTGTNAALADQVNTAIVHNKQMTGSRVEPVAMGGIVTLTGQVQNQQQKALAASTAYQVPGVSSVKNKLNIVTTGGVKAKPMVVTKIKTVVVHDKAGPAPSDNGASDNSQTTAPPASPAAPAAPATPATPDSSNP